MFVETNKKWQKMFTKHLIDVIEKEGKMTRQDAEAYLDDSAKTRTL